MNGSGYDPRFVRFVVLFNVDRDYFECHEVMEELWLEEGRSRLYQGLLQAAVGLHHWRNGNAGGAVKLFGASLEKLSGYGELEMGLDLAALRLEVERALSLFETGGGVPAFRPFTVRVVDGELAAAAEAMAALPPEARLGHEGG